MKSLKMLFHLMLFALSGVVLVVLLIAGLLLTLPDVAQLEKCFTTTMYKVHLCAEGNQYTRLKSVSPYVLHAVIASEDGSFYSHKGFDWHEIQASFETNLRSGKLRRGGSTLTQQLAKNLFLSKEKSYWRKVKEAYLAYAIETKYPKDFILEKYLNVVEFGPGLFGIKAASLHYFQKSPSELHPLEAAYLAYLLPNPKSYSRTFRKGELTPYARKMIGVILKRMSAFGKLSESAFQTAQANLDSFPWYHLSLASFEDVPSHSLEALYVSPSDFQLDEEALEEIVEESADDPAQEQTQEPDKEHEPEQDVPADGTVGDLEQ